MEKIAYFFIDDVIWVFRDIARQKPKSVFDNAFMKMLKKAHDDNGLAVQLNIFYRTDFFYGTDEFTLADTVFTVLQTHEDSIGIRGDEVIGAFNDMSTVMSVVFDGKKSLILGDIDERAESVLLSHYSEKTLKADVVQVAHHLFNYLDRLYDVIDAEYAMVPQRSETKVNHDCLKYAVVARTVKDTNFRFANDATDGFEVDTAQNKIVWTLHQEPIGGVYDGSEL